jgi:glycosyltransferase involved in cell wall biosynthesis
MRIGIDLTPLLPISTGIDNYIMELVLGLNRIDHETHFILFTNYEDRKKFSGQLSENFSIIPIAARSRILRLVAQQIILPALAIYLRLDVIHSPSFFMPLFKRNQGYIVSILDLTVFSHPAFHTRFRRSWLFRKGIALSAQRSHIIIVPSHFVKKEVLRLINSIKPDRIRVIPLGVGSHFSPSMKSIGEKFPAHFKHVMPYILFVGNIEPRKNLKFLIEGYKKTIESHGLRENLLIVGKKDWDYKKIEKLVSKLEISNRVYFSGYVDKEILISLYRNAELFIYPSIEEGFGLPPLEAMACGVPTIASDTSSLRENLSGAAELVPPDDPEALQRKIIKMLGEQKIRDHFRKNGLERAEQFQWEKTAKMTLECYKELFSYHHRTR